MLLAGAATRCCPLAGAGQAHVQPSAVKLVSVLSSLSASRSRRQTGRQSHQLARRVATSCSSAVGSVQTFHLRPQHATPESFKDFGQLLGPVSDGKQYDREDAQLQLNKGIPRFYVMRLPKTGLKFDRITYHANVTQCLSAVQDHPWYIAVGAPSGSVSNPPTQDTLRVFKIPHGHFIKLHAGSWHAGPLFEDADHLDFYNLELSDTNVVDHNTYVYKKDNMTFAVEALS